MAPGVNVIRLTFFVTDAQDKGKTFQPSLMFKCEAFWRKIEHQGQMLQNLFVRNLRIPVTSLVPDKPFQPSLMFVGKVWSLP